MTGDCSTNYFEDAAAAADNFDDCDDDFDDDGSDDFDSNDGDTYDDVGRKSGVEARRT
eukprot:CAMPEP_0184491600 /NCGR_PEP_ID=MMETSP0113_2-20130426/20831_1 /TAXON_ID=91329 /ORGANISM="Norrisiella sphaerica, Strain BC52" /LENGTH=57 /DNA_ID=CAMNT_0026876025 /DNA_START=207 /DNA_END=380 /DNA_ORIENTATION=-